MKLTLLVSGDPTGDAIVDYAGQLSATLWATGVEANVLDVGPYGTHRGRLRRIGPADWLVVQYNPFAFGHHGIAPWLPTALAGLRCRTPDLRIALMVHEPFVPWGRPYFMALAAPQRLQYAACAQLAQRHFASTELWADLTGRLGPKPTVLPAGSNVPDRRGDRDRERARLGITPETLVVTTFGSDHPSRDYACLQRWFDVARESVAGDAVFFALGSSPWGPTSGKVRVVQPGRQPAHDIAGLMAASDLYLSAHVDGISMRRGTLAAAMQHATAVVALDGHGTDSTLRTSEALGLAESPTSGDQIVRRLAASPSERRQVAQNGRAFFERELAWDVIADRLLARLK